MRICGRKPKLTPEQVREFRARRANGERLAALARAFGVSYRVGQAYVKGEHKRRYV